MKPQILDQSNEVKLLINFLVRLLNHTMVATPSGIVSVAAPAAKADLLQEETSRFEYFAPSQVLSDLISQEFMF